MEAFKHRQTIQSDGRLGKEITFLENELSEMYSSWAGKVEENNTPTPALSICWAVPLHGAVKLTVLRTPTIIAWIHH